MSRHKVIYAWMREDSREKRSEVAKAMTERYRGRLEPHEIEELHGLLLMAFDEGYCNGRGDEDLDGYYYAMYQDMRKALDG